MPDSDSSSNKDVIEAVELTSAGQSHTATAATGSRSGRIGTWLWLGFAVLLVLTLYVIFLLPRTIEHEQPTSVPETRTPTAPVPETSSTVETEPLDLPAVVEKVTTVDEATRQQQKKQAEQLLTRIIKLESSLENHAIKKWAAEEYAQAKEQGRIGEEYFRRQQFEQAGIAFETAIDQLQTLHERIQPTLEQALKRGQQALTQGDQPAAIQQFELAKAIAPTDVRATNGLQRAQTIEQLFTLLQRGSSFESHGQLQQAKSTYQEAVQLDPLSEEAKMALQRVDTKLVRREFDQLIAAAYRALQSGQYADARTAFKAAQKLLPQEKEPAAGLAKVAHAIRNEKIENLMIEAEHFEQLEQWLQAATSYEKILQLDDSHRAAQQGLLENTNKAKILKDLQLALASAKHLHQQKVLVQAEQVLAATAKLNSPGAAIERHSEELQQLVRVATTPIPIILQSDNLTEVIVYKVARLGTFNRHELQLRPGPYTIVGTRTGYRDVRKTIQVTPESENTMLAIICEEPI